MATVINRAGAEAPVGLWARLKYDRRRFTVLRTRRCCYCNGLSQSGGEGNRTPDLVNAIHALSQLSYAPVILVADKKSGREHGKLAEAPKAVKRFASLWRNNQNGVGVGWE